MMLACAAAAGIALIPGAAGAQETSEEIGRSVGNCIAAATPEGIRPATLTEAGYVLDAKRSNGYTGYYNADGAATIELGVWEKPIKTCSIRAVPKDDTKVLFAALTSELGEPQWSQLGDPSWSIAGRRVLLSPPRGMTPYVTINVNYVGEPSE